jgi:hypothetical protein
MWCSNRESCRNLFKELKILPLMSQYIICLLTFVTNNKEQYYADSEIHNTNTRHTSDIHLPSAHLNIYQKGVYYSGIQIFNSLPQDMKTNTDNPRTFKKAVTICLYINSFYSLNEYYDNNNIKFHLVKSLTTTPIRFFFCILVLIFYYCLIVFYHTLF